MHTYKRSGLIIIMPAIKLAKLVTSFVPEKIRLVIELTPGNGELFDLPMDEAGNKLSAVANYARTTFGVRTTPIAASPPAKTSDTDPKAQTRKPKLTAQDHLRKNMIEGSKRAIQVLEQELQRARAEKDPGAIKRAEEQLARGKALQEKQKANKK